jgi:peptidoglycan/LPS O-acetylase OafA/YrhL
MQHRGVLFTVLVAAGLSCCVKYIPQLSWISEGFSIIVCAVLAAVIMALVSPVEAEEEEDTRNES